MIDWRALRREPAGAVLRVGAVGALARLVGAGVEGGLALSPATAWSYGAVVLRRP